MNGETLVLFGEAVKALDDNGKVGGYLVRFSTENDPDISSMRDYFTSLTDFGIDDWSNAKSIVLYNHGMDKQLGKKRLTTGSMKMDSVGVWIEAQLEIRDEYEKAIYDLAKAGKLGWSSGVPAHLVDREKKSNGSHEVKSWFLGTDASLTPNPAEPRNSAVSLKSLVEEQYKGQPLEDHAKDVISSVKDFRDRLVSLNAHRKESGRDLSDNAMNILNTTVDEISTVINELQELRTVPKQFADAQQAEALLARIEKLLVA